MESLDLHGERAALRGNPSFVWRAGQDRRLEHDPATGALAAPHRSRVERILVDGCGVGMYVKALRPYADTVDGIDIEAEHLEIAARERARCAAGAGRVRGAALCGRPLRPGAEPRGAGACQRRPAGRGRDGARAASQAAAPSSSCPTGSIPSRRTAIYWRGVYHFGNTPLINYLPDPLRNRLAPHVRAYTADGSARPLYRPARARRRITRRSSQATTTSCTRDPTLGRWLRRITYALEQIAADACFGLSHLLVVEKVSADDVNGCTCAQMAVPFGSDLLRHGTLAVSSAVHGCNPLKLSQATCVDNGFMTNRLDRHDYILMARRKRQRAEAQQPQRLAAHRPGAARHLADRCHVTAVTVTGVVAATVVGVYNEYAAQLPDVGVIEQQQDQFQTVRIYDRTGTQSALRKRRPAPLWRRPALSVARQDVALGLASRRGAGRSQLLGESRHQRARLCCARLPRICRAARCRVVRRSPSS